MISNFKVWCVSNREWEPHNIFVDADGRLWHDAPHHPIPLKPDNHIIVCGIGAKDMNNKDIYEGDIVRKEECSPDDPAFGSYGSIGVVRYDLRILGYLIDTTETGDDGFCGDLGTDLAFNNLEVIGNIYENHDLLE